MTRIYTNPDVHYNVAAYRDVFLFRFVFFLPIKLERRCLASKESSFLWVTPRFQSSHKTVALWRRIKIVTINS